MNPKDNARDEELLARYRQASEMDAAAPSEAVRTGILAESRRVAEQLAKQVPQHPFDASRPAANDSHWKITAFGTVGAALLAALLFAPRYWEITPPTKMSMANAPVPAPKSEEVKPYASPSNSAPAPQSHSESNSLQEMIVPQADRRSSKSAGAPVLNPPDNGPTASPSAAQNYAPVPPSFSPLAASPPARAARLRQPDPSARAAEGGALSASADRAARADSALKPTTLQSAVAQGDVAQAASLLDQGAVIDARDKAGRTPLMLAVIEDRVEIVRLLLARGADPNAADHAGHTPLQQATKRNLQGVAALLEQAGAH